MRLVLSLSGFLIVMMMISACGNTASKRDQFLIKGNMELDDKQYRKAIQYYQEALKIDSSYHHAYNNMGLAYYRSGDPIAAIESYSNALLFAPYFDDARFNRINVFLSTERYDRAYDDLSELDDNWQDSIKFQFYQGLVMTGLKRYDEAGSSFEKALKMDPQNIELMVNLANIHYFQSQYEQAQIYIDKAEQIDAAFIELRTIRGLLALESESFDKAEADLKAALEARPRDAYLLNNMAYYFIKTDNFEQAESYLRRSRSIKRNNPWQVRNQGLLAMKQGNDQKAEEMLLKSLELDEKCPKSALYLSRLFAQRGEMNRFCEFSKLALANGDIDRLPEDCV
ncbi:MAG: tetratricopeptide repeat protein [Cyclobacteriaceae bacterium]|nr:tetratricopeptide repeat protein [Cyclobacteriaceae bacterium]MCH8516404.1 tetratricopeptide repeat protein [Cyclobacteriaceae bacterium]